MSEANVAGLRLGWFRPVMGRSRMIPAATAAVNFAEAAGLPQDGNRNEHRRVAEPAVGRRLARATKGRGFL